MSTKPGPNTSGLSAVGRHQVKSLYDSHRHSWRTSETDRQDQCNTCWDSTKRYCNVSFTYAVPLEVKERHVEWLELLLHWKIKMAYLENYCFLHVHVILCYGFYMFLCNPPIYHTKFPDFKLMYTKSHVNTSNIYEIRALQNHYTSSESPCCQNTSAVKYKLHRRHNNSDIIYYLEVKLTQISDFRVHYRVHTLHQLYFVNRFYWIAKFIITSQSMSHSEICEVNRFWYFNTGL